VAALRTLVGVHCMFLSRDWMIAVVISRWPKHGGSGLGRCKDLETVTLCVATWP
jgi:hypothetical protein